MLDQLATLNPDGEPPKTRLSSAEKAYEIWNQLRMADAVSSFERAKIDSLYDNVVPYNQNTLDTNGQGYRVNVSWGFAPTVLDMAQSGYIDMINAIDTLFTCPTKKDLPPEKRKQYEGMIAEAVTKMIRSWRDFMPTFLRLTSTFIKHAVSIATFDNEWDWRFDAKGLSDFKIPRKTKVGQDNIDVACWLRFYSMSQLFQFIKDPDTAEANGWNVEAVKKVIMQSINNSNTFTQWYNWEWEKLEVELRNNDYYWTYGTAQTQNIRVVHMVWQEFDGSLSYGAVCDDPSQKDWLCKKLNRYDSTYNAFVIFTYGVGTNDYYHGIRGQGYQIFPIVGALNRACSQLLEVGMFGSSPIFQPKDESAMEQMQFVPMGAYSLISPGVDLIPQTMAPNVATGVMPIINQFTTMFREQTANANTQALMDSNKEMTKAEVDARLGSVAKMSVTSQSLFADPWEALLQEVVRRAKRRDYSQAERGGDFVVKLHAELLKMGGQELLEAFFELDTNKLRATRAIGSGSEAARQLALSQLMPLMPYLPESGRANLIFDVVANSVTYRNADRYTNAGSNPGVINQEGLAYVQNSILMRGGFQPVLPDEDYIVHAKVHGSIMPQAIQQADQALTQAAEMEGTGQQADLQSVASLLQGLQMLTTHMAETVQKIAINPSGQQMVGEYKKLLQQANEITWNGVEQINAMMSKQAKAAQQQGQQAGNPEMAAELEKIESQRALNAEKINAIRTKAQTENAIKLEDAQFNRAIKDAETAQKLQSNAALNRQKRRAARTSTQEAA